MTNTSSSQDSASQSRPVSLTEILEQVQLGGDAAITHALAQITQLVESAKPTGHDLKNSPVYLKQIHHGFNQGIKAYEANLLQAIRGLHGDSK